MHLNVFQMAVAIYPKATPRNRALQTAPKEAIQKEMHLLMDQMVIQLKDGEDQIIQEHIEI